MSTKKVYARYGFTDVIEPIHVDVSKYVDVKNAEGKVIGSIEGSLICYELEDGTECNENGTAL